MINFYKLRYTIKLFYHYRKKKKFAGCGLPVPVLQESNDFDVQFKIKNFYSF